MIIPHHYRVPGRYLFQKKWQILPISNPKADLHYINAHTKSGENPLKFIKFMSRKKTKKTRVSGWQLCQKLTKFAH